MNRKILGKRIREERIRIGLTQEQVAEFIDVSTTYIGFIERGERSVTLEKLILLADCFHISIDSLINEIPAPKKNTAEEDQLLFLWNRASPEERDMILSIIDVIINKTKRPPGQN